MSMLSSEKFNRLKNVVDWSIKSMATPRNNRVDMIKQYVGSHYSDGGSNLRVPTNLLELAVNIYVRHLIPHTPRCMISTKIPSLQPQAKDYELAVNQVPDEIGLEETLREIATEAIFAFGVVKVGLETAGDVLGHPYGKVFVDTVSLDDYFIDMTAKSRKTIQFEGNDYWMDYDIFMDTLGKGSDITADDHTVIGDDGRQQASGISAPEGGETLSDKVWLRDIWLPRDKVIVTYAVKSGRQVAVVDWDGPENGPYHKLMFNYVPGNILPLPPVALWCDLHELGNALYRKLRNQALSQKTILGFTGGTDEDVSAFKNAADGDGIKYSGVKPEKLTSGGADQVSLALFLQNRDMFSYFAGNIDLLGGLSPASDTLGQDKLLSDAASSRIRSMAQEMVRFTRDLFKAIAWYEWTDPVRERILRRDIPGTDLYIDTVWSPETREGDYLDFNFDIDVYSLQDNSPSVKLQKLGMIYDRYILPLMPVIQQQGGEFNVKELFALLARYSDTPELASLIQFSQQEQVQTPQSPQGDGAQPSRLPVNTKRTYERVNRPGATMSGKSQILQQALLGGNPQEAEKRTLFGGVS